VSSGQLLTAIEVARDGLARCGHDPMLEQQLALALAQTGALDPAREVLAKLLKESADDEETLSLLGRVYKELWRRANSPADAAEAIQQACKYYGDAFAKNEAYYPGINLAFTLAAAGEREKAEECARKVAKLCRAEISKAGKEPDGWLLATLAEALVHQGDTSDAAKYYGRAAKIFAGRWRDLASMRRQAREILGFAKAAPEPAKVSWLNLNSIRRRVRAMFGREEQGQEWLDRCFEFPSVVVFSGHMIDRPGRTPARFPPRREPEVREKIRQELLRVRAGFGYSSAACGGDIIFSECLLEMGAKVNLVLPCPVDAFKRQSVSYAGADWERRFHSVLGNATTLLIANASDYATSDVDPASSKALVYSNRIVTGLAVLQTLALDVELQTIALWDGNPGDGFGGTSSVVAEWERRQMKPHVLRLDPVADAAVAPAATSGTAAPKTPKVPVVPQEIKAMVSADIVNFKKINEAQMSAYIHEFMGAIARLIFTMPGAPGVAESWGASHYFVFDGLREAAIFAIELRDLVVRTPWAEHGLPAELGVRIVLHAGPVFAFEDPVSRRAACIGSHVTRATRINPVTPQGQVYVTQEFAALCGAEGVSAVSFEFLGRLPTAKLFEDAPLYRLDRRKEDPA
jgi:tetratricopeptide (TPR) repeat protein/class 3 adenylate cyclase